MAIKIYTEYIARNTTVDALYPQLIEASDYVFSYLERQYLTCLLRLCKEEEGKPEGEQKSSREIDDLLRQQSESDLDADSSLIVIPNQGDVLILIYGRRATETLYLSRLPELESYSYWRNPTPEAPLSEEERAAREKRWGEALRDWKLPARSGLILENSFDMVRMLSPNFPDRQAQVLARTFGSVQSFV